MTELLRPRWTEQADYQDVYEPWAESVINGEAVQKLFTIIARDKAAFEDTDSAFTPDLTRLSTQVTFIPPNESVAPYTYDLKHKHYEEEGIIYENGGDELTISRGTVFSVKLRPDSRGWKIGFADTIVRGAHPLMGEGFSYSPEVLIGESSIRSLIELVLHEVADNIET